MAIRSGTGQGGKSYEDRILAAQVRTKVLEAIRESLEQPEKVEKWSEYKKQLVLKMSTSILPRLNELSGPDGGDIPLPIYGGQSVKVPGHDGN